MGQNGEMAESYGYDEFGQELYGNGNREGTAGRNVVGSIQPFGYTGYQYDETAGSYYAQAREYLPSVGKFASCDLDKFIRIKNAQSINLYNYCMLNPVRYIDPRGNDLEEKYPLTTQDEDNAVQINVSGNDITIDVYVDFKGDESLTTANGTSCKELAIAGIENWSGNYTDVFGEDVTVTVNIHEGEGGFWKSQKYLSIYLWKNGIPVTFRGFADWSNSSTKAIYMFNRDPRNTSPFSDLQYERTITHEMGHVFGLDDGYGDDPNIFERILGITVRPDAYELGIIDKDDIMHYAFRTLNISSTDIEMLILAYFTDSKQFYADYSGHRKSSCID